MSGIVKRIIISVFISLGLAKADGINLGMYFAGESDNGAVFIALKHSLCNLKNGALILDRVALHNILKFKSIANPYKFCDTDEHFESIFRDVGRSAHYVYWKKHEPITLTRDKWVLFRSRTPEIFYLLVPSAYRDAIRGYFNWDILREIDLPQDSTPESYKALLDGEKQKIFIHKRKLRKKRDNALNTRRDELSGKARLYIEQLTELGKSKEKDLCKKLGLLTGKSDDRDGFELRGLQRRLLRVLEAQWEKEVQDLRKEISDIDNEVKLLEKGLALRENGDFDSLVCKLSSDYGDLQKSLCSVFKEGSGLWNIVIDGHGCRGVDPDAGRKFVREFYRHSICGFSLTQFINLLKFLSEKVQTKLIMYKSCHAGGQNFDDICSQLEHDFPLVVASTGDRYSYSAELYLSDFFAFLDTMTDRYSLDGLKAAFAKLNAWDTTFPETLWHNITKIRMNTNATIQTLALPLQILRQHNVSIVNSDTEEVLENPAMIILDKRVVSNLEIRWTLNIEPRACFITGAVRDRDDVIIQKLKISFNKDDLGVTTYLRNLFKTRAASTRETLLCELDKLLKKFVQTSFYKFLNRGRGIFIADLELHIPRDEIGKREAYTLHLKDIFCKACEHCDTNDGATCEHKKEHVRIGEVSLLSNAGGRYILGKDYF